MKNKLMFIGLAVITAGSSVQAKLQSVPVMLQHAGINGQVFLNQTCKALVPLFTPVQDHSKAVCAQIQEKLAKFAADSRNLDIIQAEDVVDFKDVDFYDHRQAISIQAQKELAEEYDNRSYDPITGFEMQADESVYGHRHGGWKQAFAKTFAPLAALFAGTATVDRMNSSALVAAEVAAPVAEATSVVEVAAPVAEATTSVVQDIVDKTIADNVLSVATKSSVAAPIAAPVAMSFTDKVRALAVSTGTNVANAGKSAYQTTIGGETLGYFKYDRQVATTAAVAATVGVSYALCKAYKNGFFSKLNPFGKAAEVQAPVVVEEVKTEEVKSSVVQAPVLKAVRATRNNIRWN